MRGIAAPFFEQSPFLLGPVLTLVLFFVVFLGVVLHVARSKSLRFESQSRLPLSDEGPISAVAESRHVEREGR